MVIRRVVTVLLIMALLVTASAAMAEVEDWTCIYDGTSNTMNFCKQCGRSKEDATTWLCEACGSRNKVTANFCTQCGTAKNQNAQQEESEPEIEIPTLEISAVDVKSDGAVITWIGGTEPFTVVVGTRKDDGTLAVIDRVDLISNMSCTLYQMAPGVSYGFEVSDANGISASADFIVPEAVSFVDGALLSSAFTISVEEWRHELNGEAKPARFVASDIASQQAVYGVDVRIGYPQLARTRTYATLAAVKAPNGYSHVIDCGTIDYQRVNGRGEKRLTINLGGFFSGLYEAYGSIQTGEYRLVVFLNGMNAVEGVFSIE